MEDGAAAETLSGRRVVALSEVFLGASWVNTTLGNHGYWEEEVELPGVKTPTNKPSRMDFTVILVNILQYMGGTK